MRLMMGWELMKRDAEAGACDPRRVGSPCYYPPESSKREPMVEDVVGGVVEDVKCRPFVKGNPCYDPPVSS